MHTGDKPLNSAKSIYRITATWTESGITWNNQPAYNSTAVAVNTNTDTLIWENYDVTSAIKDMIENGGANYGFMLKFPSETSYKGARIRSSEYTTATDGPKLKITYTIGGADTQAPAVKVTSPNGGEILKAGASHNITWTATDNVGVVSRAIYFTSNSGTAWTKIDSAATNTGTFAWTVPNVSSKTCKVRILAYDAARNIGNDMSDTLFFIDAQAPQVTVTAPAAGDTLKQGTVFAVKWTATDDISITSRAIYYSTNNGTNWTKIDSANTNTGTLNWTVPNVTSSTCLIRVDAYDPVKNKGTAQSGVFRIEPATGIIPDNIIFTNGVTYRLTVTNIQGKEILSCNITNINELNRIKSTLPSGVHIIRIKASDKSFSKKLWFAK